MTPLERAARALYNRWLERPSVVDEAARNGPHPSWERLSSRGREPWVLDARAMLRALYEPSDAMIDAGDKHTGNWTLERGREDGTSAYPCWQSMIDEALRT